MQSGARFPLTLSFSLREREQIATVWGYPRNSEHFPMLRMALPLPEGEGWGEGEGRFRMETDARVMKAQSGFLFLSSAI
jgi:hypothetical protein